MRRPLVPVISVALLLALASEGFAVRFVYEQEEIGPAKPPPGAPDAGPDAPFRYSPLRVYWRESLVTSGFSTRGQVVAAFRGDADAANEALATFATLPAMDKEVRLFPGPGWVRSANGNASFPCDWEVRWTHLSVPRGNGVTTESWTAVLTLFVARAGPIPEANPRAGRWVEKLNDDRFLVREKASRALERLGDAALPALRRGLDGNPSLEQRLRIRRLLDGLWSIHLARVRVPAGVRVVSLDELVRQAEKDWHSGDLGRSLQAATRLAEWAEYSEDTLPLLVEALRDQREQVRDQALGAFTRLGKRGAGALAPLKAAAGEARTSVPPDALRKALRAVEEGPDGGPGEVSWRENRRLRAAITDYCHKARW